MGTCCGHDHNAVFDGMSADYKRRLWLVIALNAGMFIVEMIGGHAARSKALQADALDFFGDSVTYGLSLAVIGMTLKTRAMIALAKGLSLLMMGLWVSASTLYQLVFIGMPEPHLMGGIGFLALLANIASVLLLMHYKDGDANVRSVWLCSRNDAIGNLLVMLAAAAVWFTATGWPDVIVATIMAGLFLSSAIQILQQGIKEFFSTNETHSHDNEANVCGLHTHEHQHKSS